MNQNYSIYFFVIILFMSGCGTSKNEDSAEAINDNQVTESTVPRWIKLETGTSASLRGLHTVNDQIAWASGSSGSVLRTINGGKTWKLFTVKGAEELDFRDIQGFDENTAIIISAGLPAKIYKTVNGGETWQQKYLNNREGIFFDAMDFWDDDNGIAFSDPIEGRLFVIITEDGGDTWKEISKENFPQTMESEAGFAASGTCLRVQGNSHAWIGLGGPAARVFYTTDKGKSWQVSETPIMHDAPTKGIFSLAFNGTSMGLAVGGDYANDTLRNGNAALTNDGGKSWKVINENNPGGFRSCVEYLDSKGKNVIAVGTSGCDFSEDGGINWIPMDTIGYHAVSFAPDGETGFASGSNGRIAKFSY
ncbi:hypothetical protein QQ008_27835 [Fulvivirgaceae bacterium BMA10]|uniref:Photosynthesis system II assembly factor Ycf48/Hcf136-like domain-containing protein n=1 Tax=Splendidivirga corallicola TaxID=3051826 RepID=A0ABT8KWW0_9BACT|nr:hypothetical protein [Fulvivirgaceae bacterium BMA10]